MLIKKKIIQKMIEKNLDAAYFAIGERYEKHPSAYTAHNFGTLLSKYGHEISCAPSGYPVLAETLLLQAKEQKAAFITLKELGDLYLDRNDYDAAITCYTGALAQKSAYAVYYNLALSYYRKRDYAGMRDCLSRGLADARFSVLETVSLREAYGFACGFSVDRRGAAEALSALGAEPMYEFTPDTLKLAYLCGDDGFIARNYRAVFDRWMVNAADYAILHWVFYTARPEESGEFESWVNNRLLGFYADNPDIESDVELMAAIRSDKPCPEVEWVVAPVFTCDFYG